jgi:hypothetical protein
VPAIAAKRRHGEVLADRHPAEQRLPALARHVDDAVLRRVHGRAKSHLPITLVADDLAGDRAGAAEGVEELILTVALQTRDADELAGMDVHADRPTVHPKQQAPRAERELAAPLPRALELLPCVLRQLLRAGHQPDELAGRPVAALERGHGIARPHHGDAVADLADLVHAVGDEDDSRAASAEALDDLEQAIARGHVERGGRLVQNQDARLAKQGANDAAGLAVAQGDLLDGPVEIQRPTQQLFEHRASAGALLPRRHTRADEAVDAEPDVVEHGPRLRDKNLLEDGDDARLLGDPRGAGGEGARSLELDRARVWSVHPAQDLHQRALTRAVLADERVHLPGAELERRFAEGLCGTEGLGHPRHANEGAGRLLKRGCRSSSGCRHARRLAGIRSIIAYRRVPGLRSVSLDSPGPAPPASGERSYSFY